jgi:hypothetical protein
MAERPDAPGGPELLTHHPADFPPFGWPNLQGVPVVAAKEALKRIR